MSSISRKQSSNGKPKGRGLGYVPVKGASSRKRFVQGDNYKELKEAFERHKGDPVIDLDGSPEIRTRVDRLNKLLEMVEPVPAEWLSNGSWGEDENSSNSFNSFNGDAGSEDDSIHFIRSTPPTLSDAAYHGFIGDFLKRVDRYTEATDAGVLAHMLTAIGSIIGPGPHVWGGGEQPARLNVALVGPTSSGRKGTSSVPVNMLMELVAPSFWKEQLVRGLSSGEGLIAKVSDQRVKTKTPTKKAVPGRRKASSPQRGDGWRIIPAEKRLCVVEPEFSKVLMQTRRDGNILSQILRETFDSGNLAVLTRDPLHANNAHICITGHITPEELKRRLSEMEMANGFGNRFLWLYVKSDKMMPNAPPLPQSVLKEFADRLKPILAFARKQGRLKMDATASKLWEKVYASLRADQPGLSGALIARGESIVLRLALLYALLDKSRPVRREHLNAALAVWDYNEASVQLLFGEKSGNSLADSLYRLLRTGPMMKKDIYKHTSSKAGEIDNALAELKQAGLVRRLTRKPPGRGRPAEVWERIEPESGQTN